MSNTLDNFSILIVVMASCGVFLGLSTVLILTMLDLLEMAGFASFSAKYRSLLQSFINRLF